MIKEKSLGNELLSLMKEKGNACISIIVPTHRLSPDRRVDKSAMDKALDEARQLLQYKFPEANTKPLLEALDASVSRIDYTHNADGLGLYVSPHINISIPFDFPVETKVMVGNKFELRDLLFQADYSIPYFVLLVTENGTSLFEGKGHELREINDGHFPTKYEEQYIYSPPSQSGHFGGYAEVKGFEKDKSELLEIRMKDFYRQTDKQLQNYLKHDEPLILLGTEKELALYEMITGHKEQVVGKTNGNYHHDNPKQLADIAWPTIRSYLDNQSRTSIAEFKEEIGRHRGISGIQEVWEAARSGKVLKLLVEKDYRVPGFVDEDAYRLYLRPPKEKHKIVADAVDDIIEMVLEKKGTVIFSSNDSLKDFGRIAVISRY